MAAETDQGRSDVFIAGEAEGAAGAATASGGSVEGEEGENVVKTAK